MKNILCFGDSNTWGLNPNWVYGKGGRHAPNVRWPGKLQELLGTEEYHIIEEGLNGRTTVFDNNTNPGRNGMAFLPIVLDSQYPLDCVIIMLGTNDCLPLFNAGPIDIGRGLTQLIQYTLNPFNYMFGPPPKVIIAVPVPLKHSKIGATKTDHAAIEKSNALADVYKGIADMYGCGFVDLGKVAETSDEDGVHLQPEAHAAVAAAIAEEIKRVLS